MKIVELVTRWNYCASKLQLTEQAVFWVTFSVPAILALRGVTRFARATHYICTAPDLCKNVSLAVLFGSKGNSYTVSTQSDICIYTHILHNIQKLDGEKK